MLKNRGIAFRLSVYILAISGIILISIVGYNYMVSEEIVLRNARMNAETLGSATVNRIETVLCSSAKIPQNIAYALENTAFTDAEIKSMLESVVRNNPEIYGSCIAFEPYLHDRKLEYYAPYSWRKGNSIEYQNLGNEKYQYFYWDWYQIPKELGRPIWSEPYFDEGGGDIVMTTYSVPFYRQEGGRKVFSGIVTVDISLSWLEDLISYIKIYESGFAFIVSRNGTIISHPNRKWIMNESLFSLAEEYSIPKLRGLGKDMTSGRTGFVEVGGVLLGKGRLFYTPLISNGWSLGIYFPHGELFSDMRRLNTTMAGMAISGMILLIASTLMVTRRITRPLAKLADITNEIGKGNFHAQLPPVYGQDEIGRLTGAFEIMQKHLAEYVANLKETTAAKEKIESELRIAHDIQMSIIPKLFPPYPDRKEFDIYAILEPAKSVGGDLYDFFLMDQEHLCLAVGDVSGKGVPASLFMAITRTLLRAKALDIREPQKIVSGMNDDLCKDNDMSMFVTFFLAVLEVETGRLFYCNGGHNRPYVVSAEGKVRPLEETHGMPLGISECGYSFSETVLGAKEKIIIYTDGVTEASDTQDRLYGEEKLERALGGTAGKNPRSIVADIMTDIKTFTAGAEQSDDITILAVEYLGK